MLWLACGLYQNRYRTEQLKFALFDILRDALSCCVIRYCNDVTWAWNFDSLSNSLFRLTTKETSSKLRIHWLALCVGKRLVSGGFPAQRARNADGISMLWRHHEIKHLVCIIWDIEGHVALLCWGKCYATPNRYTHGKNERLNGRNPKPRKACHFCSNVIKSCYCLFSEFVSVDIIILIYIYWFRDKWTLKHLTCKCICEVGHWWR